jgi:thiamine biosynthesis protein ThiS
MEILLNGQRRAIREASTIRFLIEQLGLNPAQVAVEVNRQLVTRTRWSEHVLKSGDQVEVVHFVGGGEQ